MIGSDIVGSSCDLCSQYCGILVHIEDGKITKVTGDHNSPINRGKLCVKGQASLEYLYHPDRLKYPLRRVGARGEGKWQRISWDEALDIIVNELIKARDNYGAESVAIIRGARKGLQDDYMTRFANAFGTPNIVSASYVCFIPRQKAYLITHGFVPYTDYEGQPACLVVWGAGMDETSFGDYLRAIEALDKGTKLMVIDPIKTGFAERADLWIQPRPGSDLALALAMINVMVNERLFDKAFVDKWITGFDELKVHVQDYPPEKVEEITWVSAEMIREAARFYALNRPACIRLGNGIEQNVNSFQTARAIAIMTAITGNLGIPGGESEWLTSEWPTAASPQVALQDKITIEKRHQRIGAGYMMPINFYVLPQMITRAILDNEPSPIHAMYVQSSNPLLTHSNAQETYRAIKKLDFVVVADMFMTPTASLADVILPVAGTYLEFDSINRSQYYPIVQIQQKVAQIGECWSDHKILSALAQKLGFGEYFWDSEEEFLDSILEPVGLTFKEFRKVRVIPGIKRFRSYQVNGFKTPSGKVELYSNQLKDWGFDPIPVYYEQPETPYSAPDLAEEYPLIFTSRKSVTYRHSQGRQTSALRDKQPNPVVDIHPETANKLGIKENDWVYIETKRGRIKQKAMLTTVVDPRVVAIDYAWWFPEKGVSKLFGWAESNLNILTDDKPPYNREMGSPNLRGILCRVYKAPLPK